MYFWVQTFNLSLIFFRENLLVLEKYQCPTFTEKPATCGSRPDLKPKRKRFRTGPSKDLKKRLLLTNVSFMILFVWTNLKRDTKKQSPLLSHLPFVKGEPSSKITGGCLSLLGQHYQTESHEGSWLHHFSCETVVQHFPPKKRCRFWWFQVRWGHCMFGRYIYRDIFRLT